MRRVQLPGTAALTALIAFPAGSRVERTDEHGAAHLLEHMIFKGGDRFPTHREVNAETDRLGARLNALTGNEIVAFHIRVRAERALEAIGLLADIVVTPRIDPAELESERGVVIQEIARAHDQPRSRALDLSGPSTFGEHPLGRPILGTEESVSEIDAGQLASFRQRTWSPDAGVLLLVGNCSHVDADTVAGLFSQLPEGEAPVASDPPPDFEPRVLTEQRDSAQSHLVLSWRPQLDVADPRVRAALTVYAMALGGSLGSRLATEIREERGWAYTIRAEADPLCDSAALYVTAGLAAENVAPTIRRCVEIVGELSGGGLRSEEIERARSAAAGRRALAFENSTLAATHLAEEQIGHNHLTEPAAEVAALDAVGEQEVHALAAAFGGRPSIACVGPQGPRDLEALVAT